MWGQVEAGHRALEIGPGTGFCTNYLKAKGVEVNTLDIDQGKNPDIVANIVDFEPREKVNHLLAFEVFEHIPYSKCLEVWQRLSPYCDYLYLSVPFNELILFSSTFYLPIFKH